MSDRNSKFKVLKDIIAMANTPRNENAYIILGVEKSTDNTYKIFGVNEDIDDADLQQFVANNANPTPEFSYSSVRIDDAQIGIITILPRKIGPCMPAKDHGNLLKRNTVYFRRGSMNDQPNSDELREIISWILNKSLDASVQEMELGVQWHEFIESVRGFETGREYILVATPLNDSAPRCEGIGWAPWRYVVDLDPESETKGLLHNIKQQLEYHRSLHYITKDSSTISLKLGTCTYWYFAHGLEGLTAEKTTTNWKTWRSKFGSDLQQHFKRLAQTVNPKPVSVVCLANDPNNMKHLDTIFDMLLGVFGHDVDYTIIAEDNFDPTRLKDDYEANVINIPLEQLSEGIKSTCEFKSAEGDEHVALPGSAGTPISIANKDSIWLSEELDIVHLNSGRRSDSEDIIGKGFYKGARPTWYHFATHCDIPRDKTDKIAKRVQEDLARRRTVRINLYHYPGAGGTTIANRLAWDFHESHPVALLKQTTPAETISRIEFLYSKSQQPLLLLADSGTISERESDDLFQLLSARQVPVVFVQVRRRFQEQTEKQRAFYVRNELSLNEAGAFCRQFTLLRPARSQSLKHLLDDAATGRATPFHFALTAFEEDFVGVQPYVHARMQSMEEIQRQIILYISLSYHYAQKELPASAFSEMLNTPGSKRVKLRTALPDFAFDLLVEPYPDSYRPAHELLALEVIEQSLSPRKGDRRAWKQHLGEAAKPFIRFSRGRSPIASEYMLEVNRRIFIYRDNTDFLGTERSGANTFSQLISDIPSDEGAAEVLEFLCEQFPDEAHFWGHLGRYYSSRLGNYSDARRALQKALAIQSEDPLLHHMLGMVDRKEMRSMIEYRKELTDAITLAKAGSDNFQRSRDLNPGNEHAYISEVQMICDLLDYAQRITKKDVLSYLASEHVDAYLREALQKAEWLIYSVPTSKELGVANIFVEDCRARIDKIYGRYDEALEAWNNLLDRGNVFRPPIRRQLVHLYVRRRNDSWDELTHHELQRVASLLEENIRQEGHTGTDVRLWLRAVRRLPRVPSNENIIEKLAYWRSSSAGIDASYYLYVFYVLQALDGIGSAAEKANELIEECRARARTRRNRTISFEWLGHGGGAAQLVHHSRLGEWNSELDFWENYKVLRRIKGRIANIIGPEKGQIAVTEELRAFFVPGRGNFAKGKSENRKVTLFLGFSYDGLRAWAVQSED